MSDPIAESWLATLVILTENAIAVLPEDLPVTPTQIAEAIVQGASNTGRVEPQDFDSNE